MARASWRGRIIADSQVFEEVEGNVYFPPAAVDMSVLRPSTTSTSCNWKGDARYYDVVVDGEVNRDAAWYYADPKPVAAHIRNHIAFWRGVRIER